MKNKIYFRIGVLLLLVCSCVTCNRDHSENAPPDDTFSIYSTTDLYNLTNEWAAVFSKINPEVKISVINADGQVVEENLDNSRNVCFVSGDFDSVIYARTLWKVVVGRNVIVPVIHAGNPLLDEISRRGISPADLSRILHNNGQTEWGSLLQSEHHAPVHLYATREVSSDPGLVKFLNADQVPVEAIQTADAKELMAALEADKYAIGICNLTDVSGPGSNRIIDNVVLLPIDKNGNGLIDYKEDVYADLDNFSRGVWIGKYPRELSSNIYTVASKNPTDGDEIAFLKWIITRGQVLLDNHGFSTLDPNERVAQVKWIDSFDVGGPGSEYYTVPKEPGFFSKPAPLIMAIILSVVLALLGIRYLGKSRAVSTVPSHIQGLAFNEGVVKSLPGLYYDKSHTWAFLDKDGLVKVGIDDFIQHVTGPITRIKMKLPGEKIKKGKQAISIIQDGKQLEICAPVSGIIREYNTKLVSNTSIINTSPCTDGWVYKIEPTNWLKEIQFLIMGSTYREWLKNEFRRLKEFLMDSVWPGALEYSRVLQDGGELKDSILKEMGPEAWEDFQTNFIDVSS